MVAKAQIGYQTLLEDFVLGDRRLAERDDIEVLIQWSKDAHGRQRRLSGARHEFGTMLTDYGSVHVRTDSRLSDRERELLDLLTYLVIFCGISGKDRLASNISKDVGRALTEVRRSLGISQDDLARELQVNRVSVSEWEAGAHSLDTQAVYRWCQGLGLVTPERTALVRIVDLSPKVLRFLQEDPERLRSLTPGQFETVVADRLSEMGYEVKLTGASSMRDGGIDLIAVPRTVNLGSVVIAAQMKHHSDNRKTGRDAVDRLLAWKDTVFGIGLLVTNTRFTRDAIWAAYRERNARFLRLRDFDDLKRWLQGRFGEKEDWKEIPRYVELAPGVVIEIPKPRVISNLRVSGGRFLSRRKS